MPYTCVTQAAKYCFAVAGVDEEGQSGYIHPHQHQREHAIYNLTQEAEYSFTVAGVDEEG